MLYEVITDSVTDEATKLELTALLEAYTAALTDKDAALASGGASLSELSQLASDARSALKDGLEVAGFGQQNRDRTSRVV